MPSLRWEWTSILIAFGKSLNVSSTFSPRRSSGREFFQSVENLPSAPMMETGAPCAPAACPAAEPSTDAGLSTTAASDIVLLLLYSGRHRAGLTFNGVKVKLD